MSTTELAQTSTTLVPDGSWHVDPAHSAITFSVVDTEYARVVSGRFTEFEGTAATADGRTSFSGSVKTASLTTDQEQRDAHLRSPDFLDVEADPEIRFDSTVVDPADETRFVLIGRLRVRGLEQEVRLDAERLVTGTGMSGAEQTAIRAGGTVDFGPFRVSVSAALTLIREG